MKKINLSSGMRFGMGVDSYTEDARGNALVYDGIKNDDGGQKITATFQMIESQESLMEAMNISVSAAVRYGTASGDAKMDFSRQHAVDSYSVYVLMKATAENCPSYMINPRLSKAALKIYRRDPELFRQAYGDCYIDEIRSGGEFFGLFSFETRKDSEKESMAAELNVAINSIVSGAEIHASMKTAMEKMSSQTKTTIQVLMSGGQGIINSCSLSQLYEIYQKFNQSVQTHGVPFQASVKDFKYLPLPPGATFAEQMVRRDIVETCGRYVVDAIKSRSRIEYILSHIDEFENPNEADLKNQLNLINAQLPKWAQRAYDCVQDVAKCDLSGMGPINPVFPKRLAAINPLAEKWQEILDHDSNAARFFPLTATNLDKTAINIEKYDCGPRNGLYKIFYIDGFPAGGLFWHPDTGAHAVYGPIFHEYLMRKHCINPAGLGYPKNDTEVDSGFFNKDGSMTVNNFENGNLWCDTKTNRVFDKLPKLIIPVMPSTTTITPINPEILKNFKLR